MHCTPAIVHSIKDIAPVTCCDYISNMTLVIYGLAHIVNKVILANKYQHKWPFLPVPQALLSCRVTALQDKLVSWFYISVPSLHLTLLTVGFQTYSADSRYSLDFQHPNNYRLRISRVKLEVSKSMIIIPIPIWQCSMIEKGVLSVCQVLVI